MDPVTERGEGMRYMGPERRRNVERRQGHDRREMIRFELDKEDRRRQEGWQKNLASRY